MAERLANRLKSEREARGWTQAELAARVGVSRKTINTIENGVFVPSTITALKVADAFGHSRSDARRLLAQGGVKLDGEPLPGDELDVPAERLDGRVLQVGKRHFRRLQVG